MGPRCAVGILILALSTAASSAAANKPLGADPATKCSNVKNAPFSAEVITEYDRTLDNGGHIHRESRGAIFRDSQGRMRTENQPSAIQPGSVKADHITINDPVRQVIICLDPRTRTATVVRFSDIEPNPPMVATNARQNENEVEDSPGRGARGRKQPRRYAIGNQLGRRTRQSAFGRGGTDGSGDQQDGRYDFHQ